MQHRHFWIIFRPNIKLAAQATGMKIIIIHHHLNPGGVTRIIQSQVSSLRKQFPATDILILTGKMGYAEFFKDMNIPVEVFPELDYLLGDEPPDDKLDLLKSRISSFLNEKISKDDIVHVHNLNLGKNPVLTLAITEMSHDGYKVFNHCHDFAEDRKPNMAYLQQVIHGHFGQDTRSVMYPNLPNYLYGTINTFDHDRIIKSGIPAERVIHLPNPVHFETKSRLTKAEARASIYHTLGLEKTKPLITYPVRVIRRKNIGELILLSALYPNQAYWLVTMPPQNPEEVTHYNAWKKFCADEKIDLIWEAGTKVDFEELLIATNVCISTSVREGFGMVFLEPWLLGTPVMGRNISYVTKDLLESGVEFPLLYDEITVDYEGKNLDFGQLEPDSQKAVIKTINANDAVKKLVKDMNPKLDMLFESTGDDLITHNKLRIKQEYSLENYASRLHEIYRKLA